MWFCNATTMNYDPTTNSFMFEADEAPTLLGAIGYPRAITEALVQDGPVAIDPGLAYKIVGAAHAKAEDPVLLRHEVIGLRTVAGQLMTLFLKHQTTIEENGSRTVAETSPPTRADQVAEA